MDHARLNLNACPSMFPGYHPPLFYPATAKTCVSMLAEGEVKSRGTGSAVRTPIEACNHSSARHTVA